MNTQYPSQLTPVDQDRIPLPSGKVMSVPKATIVFKKWPDEPIAHTFGGKPLISSCGEPVFAELAVLQLFLDSGWSGRWVETYAAKKEKPYYFSSWADTNLKGQAVRPLPADRDWSLLKRIRQFNGGHSGFWDVMAWNGSKYIFAEVKRGGKDRIRGSQAAWLESSLNAGLDISSFLVVEWSYDGY